MKKCQEPFKTFKQDHQKEKKQRSHERPENILKNRIKYKTQRARTEFDCDAVRDLKII